MLCTQHGEAGSPDRASYITAHKSLRRSKIEKTWEHDQPPTACATRAGLESQQITFGVGEVTQELRFPLMATTVGSVTLTFTASDGAGASDALKLSLPVEGLQTPVHIASSFAIRGDDATDGMSEWKEGLVLPAAEAGAFTAWAEQL